MQAKILQFKHGSINLHYPQDYYIFLEEQYILDVYRSYLLKDGDVVLDLGANIGAFTLIASRKVGRNGTVIAIEPNKEDYDLLRQNLEANHCKNVIPVNIGVSDHQDTIDVKFWGRNFRCNVKPLTEVLQEIKLDNAAVFIKMDIEGYEIPVIKSSTDIFRRANIVSVECHDNRSEVDEMLFPLGFRFNPVTTSHLAKSLLRNAIAHPLNAVRTAGNIVKSNPQLLYKILFRREYFGHTKVASNNVVGSYTKFAL